jgi:hypothetical protein
MKKIAAALAVLAVLIMPLTAARADDLAHPAIVQGSGLAAAGVAAASVDPNVDFWPIYSSSMMDNDSSHGLSGAIWPGFLIDAFAWLYGLQPQERAGLGISETQWPNQPHVSNASSTGFMFENFADGCAQFFGAGQCKQVFDAFGPPPASLGTSSSQSGNLTSSGEARGARFEVPGILDSTDAWTHTDTHVQDGKTVVESVFTARDVTIGGVLHIDMIQARSTAQAAGDRAGSAATSTLKIVGAEFAGTPVTIDDQGLHAQGDAGFDDLDSALAEQGLQVRGSQGRESVDPTGEFVDAASGGLLITVSRERAESAFPQPLIDEKNAACAAAANSPLNTEITHVRVDEPNPLYGTVPVPGMPQRAQLDQSVPPPVQCPFTNRDLGVTLVLGLTDASARYTPLPEVLATGAGVGIAGSTPGTPGYTIPGRPGTPAAVGTAPPATPGRLNAQATLASAPRQTGDVSCRVKIVYGLIALGALLAVAGRFVLRAVSSP